MVKRKQQFKLFLTLLLSTAFILAFSQIGSTTYKSYINGTNTFELGTQVGSVDLSGLSKEQALTIVTNKVEQWRSNAEIELRLHEKTLLFETENFTFSIEESLEQTRNGEKNSLLVEIKQDEWEASLNQIDESIKKTEELEVELLNETQQLKEQIELKLDQYLLDKVDVEVLSTVRVETELLLPSVEKISTISIPAGSSFSFSKFLNDVNLSNNVSSVVTNLLSSGIYQLILETNFIIEERHIGLDLPESIPLGYEAKIDNNLNWDLAFNNPNSDDFSIAISQQEGFIQLDLLGYPFANSYQNEITNQETLEPKTIQQYDPLLLPGETVEKYTGKSGSYVEVYRKVFDEKGDRIKSELISQDFYPPQHRIELVGY
jgi:hypothetical protein